MKQTFKMQDYEITVDYGRHVVQRLRARFDDLDTGYLDFVFETIFTDENVVDYLLNDVRVGEDVVVIDEDSGISFAVNIGAECFYIKTLFNGWDGRMLMGDMQRVLRFARRAGLQVEQFKRKREECYA